jgi:hypothetical protein
MLSHPRSNVEGKKFLIDDWFNDLEELRDKV